MARSGLSKKDKQGVIIIVGSVLGLVLLALIPVIVSITAVPFDEETLCPKEQDYGHTVILVDKTDPLTPTQATLVRRLVDRVKSSMTLFEKLSIFVLDDLNYSFPEPRFALCNPGSGENASPLYQNPSLMERRFEEKFGEPLDKALDGIKLGDTRPNSPIMEMIASVSTLKDFQPSKENRRLIIFSDMLQHMPDYSHYSSKLDYDAFKGTDYARRQLVNLEGVQVRIIYLVRKNAIQRQTNRHGLFWEKYFERLGARLDEIRPSR